MKTILVPIDLGENAVNPALDEAARLATLEKAELVLLNVIPLMPTYVTAEISEEVLGRGRVRAVQALDRFVEDKRLGVPTRCHVREGHAAEEILEFARECACDLIVMASHDPGLSTYVLGSVAAHVVRHAHCSVYVVRTKAT